MGDAIVLSIIAIVVLSIIWGLYRDRKQGKCCGCSGNCAECRAGCCNVETEE